MAKEQVSITTIFVTILAVMLLFFVVVAPNENTKIASQWNLLLFGTLGSTVITFSIKKKGLFKQYFEVGGLRKVAEHLAVGFLYGFPTLIFINAVVNTIQYLDNLTTSYNVLDLGTLTTTETIFTTLVQPFSESILMITLILVLYTLFKNYIKIVPFPLAVSVMIVFIIFASFHFTIQGSNFYPRSLSGFIEFLTDTTGLGTPNYHGGLVFIPMGLFWGVLGVVYRSFWVMAGAHVSYNALVTLLFVETLQNVSGFTVNLILLLLLIVMFAFGFGKAREVLFDISTKTLTSFRGVD